MNIFALDPQPKLAAQYHCDKHVIKQLLESCQLLSTAHRVLDGTLTIQKSKTGRNVKRWVLDNPNDDAFVYSATHVNHPSAVWARERASQYLWLANMTKELCIEYTYRYGKTHKCERIGMVDWFITRVPNNIKVDDKFTLPTPAMDKQYLIFDSDKSTDVVKSYRNYYIKAKSHLSNWGGKINGRPIPNWYLENVF